MKRTFLKMWYLIVILSATSLAGAETKEVDWAAINSGFDGATYVNDDQVCVACHEDSVAAYKKTEHARIFKHGPKGVLQSRNCESCHGPRSKHVENPDDSLALTAGQYSQACLQCHQDGTRMHWKSCLHKTADVNCVSCHSVMEKRSERALLAAANEPDVCYTCHVEVKVQIQKASHHPVREGKMSCSSCHNVHGSVGKSLLKERH
ncbi:cytochrome c3 family protein [bacterium]|nr:cytochrome c3 family protein [bacterium]MCI0614842.1 cytochrome c3 family protein [bacterium]